LKQVTGHKHCDIQRYIIPVIAGTIPKQFLTAICALMDFRYLAQSCEIDEKTCTKINAVLKEFHNHKDAILTACACVGKGNKPTDNWEIPKLEFMQSVVTNICANGTPLQWLADVTEHANIMEIKDPAHLGNNQNYEAQICWHLDRTDKC
jgi:hypothetical protein